MEHDIDPAAERAWLDGLLDGTTPGPWQADRMDLDGGAMNWHIGSRTELIASTEADLDHPPVRADARLISHAPDLAARYRAALERNEALEAERDRLARILAVERGDESAAPEGWERNGDGWTRWGGLLGPHIHVRRERYQPDVWSWSSQSRASGPSRPLRWDGPAVRVGSALEAMEAADVARGGDDG